MFDYVFRWESSVGSMLCCNVFRIRDCVRELRKEEKALDEKKKLSEQSERVKALVNLAQETKAKYVKEGLAVELEQVEEGEAAQSAAEGQQPPKKEEVRQ